MAQKISVDKSTPVFTISTAASMLGISVHTLRMYEREGLILPHKKVSNHRLYSQNDIERLTCLRNAIRDKKYSISAIKALYSMIPCWAIVKCSLEDKEACPAYLNGTKPCWTYKHLDNMCDELPCQACEVYSTLTCEDIKSEIIKFTDK